MKKIIMIAAIIGISMAVFYSINKGANSKEMIKRVNHPIATVILENEQIFKIELYPEEAPNTVNNFIALVNKKFYNGMSFSKVVPGYLIQTGDPIGDGTGFPGYFIKSECKQNGFRNKLKCERGTLCMARGKRYNTEGSQFFILLQKDSNLNGHYTAFGRVVEGMDVLEQSVNVPVDADNIPKEAIMIKEIEVETFGKKYSEPQVISIYEERSRN